MWGTWEMLTGLNYRMLIWNTHLIFTSTALKTGQLIFISGWVLVNTNILWFSYISNTGKLDGFSSSCSFQIVLKVKFFSTGI